MNHKISNYFLGKTNRNSFKRIVRISIFISLGTVLIPLILYMFYFNDGISDKQEHWGVFGDFIGGIIGSLFTLFAFAFSMYSLYISGLTTLYIQDRQDELYANTDKRETEHFNREVKLTYDQNKPLPYLEFFKFDNETTLKLYNYGIGPLVITNSYILFDGKEAYNSIIHLIDKKISLKPLDTNVIYNSATTHILPPNGHKELISIKPNGVITTNFIKFQAECRILMSNCIIIIDYEDLFGNKFHFNNAFTFLQP